MKEFDFLATDGFLLHGYCWPADGQPEALLILCHGAVEHAQRYAPFAKWLAERGVCVYSHDYRNHANSAREGQGYFLKEGRGGFSRLVEDVAVLLCRAQKEVPDTPVFLFGHSMGSYVARLAMKKNEEKCSGLMLCGTGDMGRLEPTAVRTLARFANRVNTRPSPMMHKLFFGTLNKRVGKTQSDSDFISTDRAVIDKYLADPWCGYTVSAEYVYELTGGVLAACKKEAYDLKDKEKQILIIAGELDPCAGKKAKASLRVAQKYRAAGSRRVKHMVYPKMRHELLNEPVKEQVYEQLYAFMKARG